MRPSRAGLSPAQRISVRTASSASARDGRSVDGTSAGASALRGMGCSSGGIDVGVGAYHRDRKRSTMLAGMADPRGGFMSPRWMSVQAAEHPDQNQNRDGH